MGVAGTRATGFAKDPDATEERDGSLVMSGRLKKGKLTLTVFARSDFQQQNPLGVLDAKIKRGQLEGSVELEDGREGECAAEQVKKDTKTARLVVGTYNAEVEQGAAVTVE